METAQFIVDATRVYGFIGLAVAVVFLGYGIDRIDPSAIRAYPFRVLLIPGIVVLWPLVLARWLVLARGAR
ncbi:MAG: hypothetical protein ACTS3R_12185 [Inquilinaceae bacterium]